VAEAPPAERGGSGVRHLRAGEAAPGLSLSLVLSKGASLSISDGVRARRRRGWPAGAGGGFSSRGSGGGGGTELSGGRRLQLAVAQAAAAWVHDFIDLQHRCDPVARPLAWSETFMHLAVDSPSASPLSDSARE
jgi:hypothetical protein